MTEERFFKVYMSTFLAGALLLLPFAPLMGYAARKIAIAYKLDFTAGLYIAGAPYLIFFTFMGVWLLVSYWKYNP